MISELAEETFHARLILASATARRRGRRPTVRRAGARGPGRGPDLRDAVAVLDQAGLGADSPGLADEAPRGDSPLESDRRAVVDPRLDVFRDFVNSLDVDPARARSRGRAEVAPSSRPGSARPGGGRDAGSTHVQPQPPEVADRAQDDRGLAPVGEPAVRG